MKLMKKNAFTLAEILITLGIIGVVAAISLPSLYTNYKKRETVSKLKEAYSIFQQAVKLSIAENDEMSGWNLSTSNTNNSADCQRIIETYLLPYMSGASKMKTGYVMKTLGTDNRGYLYWDRNSLYQMKNGMTFSLGAYYGRKYITVDLNGISKPNRLGIDGFVLDFNPGKNNIQFYGENEERGRLITPVAGLGGECKRGDNMTFYTGAYCGALIKKDGWNMLKDYPWGNGN